MVNINLVEAVMSKDSREIQLQNAYEAVRIELDIFKAEFADLIDLIEHNWEADCLKKQRKELLDAGLSEPEVLEELVMHLRNFYCKSQKDEKMQEFRPKKGEDIKDALHREYIGRLEYISEQKLTLFLALFDRRLQSLTVAVKIIFAGQPVDPILANFLEKILSEPLSEEIRELLQQSLFLFNHVDQHLATEIDQASQTLSNHADDKAFNSAKGIVTQLLTDQFSHISEPLKILADSYKLSPDDSASKESLRDIYKNHESEMMIAANIEFIYSLNKAEVIDAWEKFQSAFNDCAWEWSEPTLEQQVQTLLEKLLNINRTIQTLNPNLDFGDPVVRETLQKQFFIFLKKEEVNTQLQQFDQFGDPSVFAALHAFCGQASRVMGDDEAAVVTIEELRQSPFAKTSEDAYSLLREFGSNLAKVLTDITLKAEGELTSHQAPKSYHLQESHRALFSRAFLKVVNQEISKGKEIVNTVNESLEKVTSSLVMKVDLDQLPKRSDSKLEISKRSLEDQAEYRYLLAKKKYTISPEETELLIKSTNSYDVTLVPKLKAEHSAANGQNPNGRQIQDYRDFANELAVKIQDLETKNKRWPILQWFGIDRYRVDHLKTAKDFVEFMAHKYEEVTHPDLRLKRKEHRGENETSHRNFVSQLSIAKENGMDAKNKTFIRLFNGVVKGLSAFFGSNRTIKALQAAYAEKREKINSEKDLTPDIKGGGMQKMLRYDAANLSLETTGKFFTAATLAAVSEPIIKMDYQTKITHLLGDLELINQPFFQCLYPEEASSQGSNFIKDFTHQAQQYQRDVINFQDSLKIATLNQDRFSPEGEKALEQVGSLVENIRAAKKALKQSSYQYATTLTSYVDSLEILQKSLEKIESEFLISDVIPEQALWRGISKEISSLDSASLYLTSQSHLSDTAKEQGFLNIRATRDCLTSIQTPAEFSRLLQNVRDKLPAIRNKKTFELARMKKVMEEARIASHGTKYMAVHATNNLNGTRQLQS